MTAALQLRRPRVGRWRDLAIVVGFVLLVSIPLLRWVPTQEMARWQAARAVEMYLNGETSAAIEKLEQAVSLLPGDFNLQLRLVDWLLKRDEPQKAHEILEVALQRIEPLAQSTLSGGSLWLHAQSLKAGVQWMRSDHPGALATIKQLQDQVRGSSETALLGQLNEITYFRALTGLELEEGRAGVAQLLDTKIWTLDSTRNYSAKLRSAGIIAAALLEYRLAKTTHTTAVLDREIELHQAVYDALLQDLQVRIYLPMTRSGLPIEVTARDAAEQRRKQLSAAAAELAALLTVRAYGRELQGSRELADADRQRVTQLGFQSADILKQLPADLDLLYYLEICMQYLDTVGYLQHRAGDSAGGVRDLNLAIAAAEVFVSTFNTDLQNLPELSFDQRQRQVDSDHMMAVLYQHRWQAHTALRMSEQASLDAATLKRLGYSVHDRLY